MAIIVRTRTVTLSYFGVGRDKESLEACGSIMTHLCAGPQ